MKTLFPLWFLLLALATAPAATSPQRVSELTLSPWFGHHAVLQRGKKTRIWGTTTPDERVWVVFRGARGRAEVEGGRWVYRFPEMIPGDPSSLVISNLSRVLVLTNVVVGDVWVVGCTAARGTRSLALNDPVERTMLAQRFRVQVLSDLRPEGLLLPWQPCSLEAEPQPLLTSQAMHFAALWAAADNVCHVGIIQSAPDAIPNPASLRAREAFQPGTDMDRKVDQVADVALINALKDYTNVWSAFTEYEMVDRKRRGDIASDPPRRPQRWTHAVMDPPIPNLPAVCGILWYPTAQR